MSIRENQKESHFELLLDDEDQFGDSTFDRIANPR